MVDSVVSSLLQNLSQLLVDEVKLLSGVKDKIKSLKKEFKFIDEFLKSSEGKRSNRLVNEVVNQIRDVANKVEDVVDTYVAKATEQRSRKKWRKFVHYPVHLKMLHDMDAEIEGIKKSIDEIYNNKDRYNIVEGEFSGEDGSGQSLHRWRRHVEEEEVVGLVHDSTAVIKLLKEPGLSRDVVSIIGIGGSGKTTLARKIYKNNEVQELFTCRAWGYVSNDYRVEDFLLSLLRCLLPETEYDLIKSGSGVPTTEREEELRERVKKSLTGKKYLVVLDDIWKTKVWDDIQGAFPDDNKGSRILITSRISKVASPTGTAHPYYLPLLNKVDSWALFCKKVFRGGDCPANLKDLGTSIVEGCGGLPLAIVVLAGLVAKKHKSPEEWLRIKNNVRWHLDLAREDGEDRLTDILKLSYDNLPRRFRPCFLYLGIYPEDYEISARELINIWIAEGFLQPQETDTSPPEPEVIGEDYLNELVDRSLVQVTSLRSDEGVKTCQIHDLLRHLCISESKANQFMEVSTNSVIGECNPRRMSLHFKNKLSLSPTKYNQSCTRSLFLFGQDIWVENNDSEEYKRIMESFKLVRVLQSRGVRWHTAPGGLNTMILLRYLKIDVIYDFDILTSICNLWNLETLHLNCEGQMTKIPREIWKLKRLKHLYVGATYLSLPSKGAKPKSERMQKLQTLCVPLESEIASMLNNNCFPVLTKLGLQVLGGRFGGFVPPNLPLLILGRLNSLHTLKITGSSLLFYRLPANLVGLNGFPPTLTKITVNRIHELDSKILGGLPNLRILKLSWGSWSGYHLDCADRAFPKLEVFEMAVMEVKKWTLEIGAMPCLSRLLFHDSYLLSLPGQLWSLTTLQEVDVVAGSDHANGSSLYESLKDFRPNNGCKLRLRRC